jgi:hypothetical protein
MRPCCSHPRKSKVPGHTLHLGIAENRPGFGRQLKWPRINAMHRYGIEKHFDDQSSKLLVAGSIPVSRSMFLITSKAPPNPILQNIPSVYLKP